jgi:hypothetical protein
LQAEVATIDGINILSFSFFSHPYFFSQKGLP